MKKILLAMSVVGLSASALATTIGLSDTPLASGTTGVKPNLMFVLDDSGSMAWDYMPDNAKYFAGSYGFNASQCNGVYYDPAFTYRPPVKSDGTSYPDADFSAAWKNGYDTSLGTTNLNTAFSGGSGSGSSGAGSYSGPAFYYTYTGTQTGEAQKDYFNTSSTFYQECDSAVGASPGSAVFTKSRLASVPTTTITVTGAGGGGGSTAATITISGVTKFNKPVVSSIKINGIELMSGNSASSSKSSTVAKNIAAKITLNGFSATVSGNVVTIACTAAAGTSSPVITYSGTMTSSVTACPTVSGTTVSSITVGGTQLLSTSATGATTTALATDIKNKITATGYSATVSSNVVTVTGPSSASNLTPVITVASGVMTLSTVAFPESTPAKVQNFANWYSYYSHRMLMMKSGVGLAFQGVTDAFRVGFVTMNNNVSPGIVDIADFTGGCAVDSLTCQRDKWYNKLYASSPNNMTPLREILSRVGQYYAHKFGTVDIYKTTITVGGSGTTSVDGIKVNGVEIMDDTSVDATTTAELAASIADQINAVQITDFGATVSGSVVTVFGPPSALSFSPVATKSGGMTLTSSAFTKTSSSSTLNDITPADPMQYSCQQNYTILSTDGYWNGSTTYKLDGTKVGQQDGDEPRPLNDGKTPIKKTTTQIQRSTSQTVQRTQQWQSSTSHLQQAAATLQSKPAAQQQTATLTWQTKQKITTATLQKQTKSSGSWGAWADVPANGSCKVGSSTNCKTVSPSTSYATFSSPGCAVTDKTATTSTSTADANGKVVTACSVSGTYSSATSLTAGQTCTGGGNVRCGTTAVSAATDVASCTTTYNGSTGTSTTNASGLVTLCPTPVWTNVASGGSCTPSAIYSCQYSNGSWSDVSSCTSNLSSGTDPWTITSGTDCRYWDTTNGATWSAYADVSAPCTAVDPSSSSPYTVPSATRCNLTAGTTVGTNSCTASTPGGQVISCETLTTGPLGVASCTDQSPASGNGYTATTCQTVVTGPTAVASCTAQTAAAANQYVTIVCTSAAGGTSDTLSDVAEYYYVTDLRDQSLGNCTGALGSNVCINNVPTSGLDTAIHQHMTTYTMGLGARGKMTGSANYKNVTTSCTPGTDGDYCAVLKGATANGTTICPWQSSGTTCNWPTPSSGAIENIDDLWHAALTGRGDYFSAANPDAVSKGLMSALSTIGSRVSSAAAAATSSLEPVTNDNYAYTARYTTSDWTGELEAKEINLVTGVVSTTALWSVAGQLNSRVKAACDNRVIKLFHAGSPNTLVDFKWNTYACDGSGNPTGSAQTGLDTTEKANFSDISTLTQYSAMSDGSGGTINQKGLATGATLVNFLRGQTSHEDFRTNSDFYYRDRKGALGDIANAQPLFVKKPFARYTDTGYGTFAINHASRTPMVYAAANDGMLHAFNATTGAEAWAFIPTAVLPNLFKLADSNYADKHKYFVDGSPAAADVFDGTNWHTILVGGLNKGGKAYYALDVTDPASPIALWEFTNANLGYSYGNPLVGKLRDGTWVVFLTSGINTADDKGHLFVVNAVTGALISDIVTPSGANLMKIAGWSDYDPVINNTVSHVYGGDLNGNIWRFDVNNSIAPTGYEATLLMTAKIGSTEQPITTKPMVALVGANIYVFVGTGKYLDSTDMTNADQQSIYGILDPMTEPTTSGGMVVTHGRADLQEQTLVQTGLSSELTATRKVTSCEAAPKGWYVDLTDTRERVNVDMKLQLGSLIVASNVPSTDSCQAGGYSWLNYFNINNGCSNTDTEVVSNRLADSLVVGISVVGLPDSSLKVISTLSDGGKTPTSDIPLGIGNPVGRRLTWREINP